MYWYCVVWYIEGLLQSWYVGRLWHRGIRRMLTSHQYGRVGIFSSLWHAADIYRFGIYRMLTSVGVFLIFGMLYIWHESIQNDTH